MSLVSISLSWPEHCVPFSVTCCCVILMYSFVFPTLYWEEHVPVCRRRERGSWFRQKVASCLRGLSGHDLSDGAGLNLW